MADGEQVELLRQGTAAWNRWRAENPGVRPELEAAALRWADLGNADLRWANLRDADLSWANLSGADLRWADLSGAKLRRSDLRTTQLSAADLHSANLRGTDLDEADLSQADLHEADLRRADLRRANLRASDLSQADLRKADLRRAILFRTNLRETRLAQADLRGANLRGADCTNADLRGANLGQALLHETKLGGANLREATLSYAQLFETNLGAARLVSCRANGVAIRNVNVRGAEQSDIAITTSDNCTVRAENLEIASFIWQLLNTGSIHDLISKIASRFVLIIVRENGKGQVAIDALKSVAVHHGYSPLVLGLGQHGAVDGTVSSLARLARFVFVEQTDTGGIPPELRSILATAAVPVQPVMERSEEGDGNGATPEAGACPWLLPTRLYESPFELLASAGNLVSACEARVKELDNGSPGTDDAATLSAQPEGARAARRAAPSGGRRRPLAWLAAALLGGLVLLGLSQQPFPRSAPPSVPLSLLCGGASGRDCRLSLVAVEPDDGVGPLVDRFGEATASIDFSPFTLDEPRIIQALADARGRGVRVRLMLEPSRSRLHGAPISARGLATLLSAGVEVGDASPAFQLTHAKYAVLDGDRALFLTLNSAAGHITGRRDFVLMDGDPQNVRFVQAFFDADWQRVPLGPIPPGFAVSPDNSNQVLAALAGSAQKTVDVYTDKLLASPILDALLEAAGRGVAVRIQSSQLDPRGLEGTIGGIRSAVGGDKVEVRAPRKPVSHAKVMVVDGERVFLGSENVEDAPKLRRRELGIIFGDSAIAARLTAVFERDWAGPTDVLYAPGR